ncbi:MAG: 5'-nucleotidase C-terminal domain-containing protein [Fermentimonas sp.]|nr:5'-nucleotidase C-terminal domain-containing protein [Fermentimonas sp.]
MNIRLIWVFALIISLFSCKPQYRIVDMQGEIIEIDSTFDTKPNTDIHKLVLSYKTQLDSEMNIPIGTSASLMDYRRPESLLTNLTSDVMKEYGDEHLRDGADIGVMNVHGHRATMPKGPVTIGNLFEIYSFDNTITFLDLKGSDLKKMFDAYARIGGAGISSNVKLVIEDRQVKSVTVDNKPIDNDKIYKIVTLDYLAEGNDNMSAFLNAISINNTGVTLRDIMIEWVQEQTRMGNEIESAIDGRIIIKE